VTGPGTYTDGISVISLGEFPLTIDVTGHQPGISQNGALIESTAEGAADYYFEVTGGSPGDLVPLLIQYSFVISTSAAGNDGGASATDRLTVCADRCEASSGADGYVEEQLVDPDVALDVSQSFHGPLPVTVSAGHVHAIWLAAYTSVGAGEYHDPGFADASAVITNTYISVDPSFPNAADYSILVSEGVGNDPQAAPEPGSMALVGSMLVSAALLVRRRVG
jgi:hypothetical protein